MPQPKVLKFRNKDQKPFEIRNKSATKAEIIIYEQIGEDWFGGGISAKAFDKELKALDPAVNELHVRINSPGGDVFDGMTIYNRLKQHKAKKIVYIDGMAASIASIIALAGDEVIIGEGALYMIHLPMTVAWGNRIEFESRMQLLMDIEDQLIGIYAKHSNLDKIEIRKMLEAETWMDADQAIENGFVDKKSEESIPIAASAMASAWFKRPPQNYTSENSVAKNILKDLKADLDSKLARK